MLPQGLCQPAARRPGRQRLARAKSARHLAADRRVDRAARSRLRAGQQHTFNAINQEDGFWLSVCHEYTLSRATSGI
jgi:hypothetical protein